MRKLHDYSFIDRSRVISYFEQLTSPEALKKPQKCPAWGVSLSIAGPKVEGKQSTSLRDATVYEAISEVENSLTKIGLVTSMDNSLNYWVETWDSGKTAFFVRDTFSGRRAVIQPSEEACAQGIRPIAVWLLDPIVHRPRVHYLPVDSAKLRGFLIEYSTETDSKDVPGASGFTALEFMLYSLEKQTQGFRQSLLGASELPDRNSPERRHDERFIAFAHDPCSYLERLGSHLGPQKTISSLFRVRFIWDEDGYHDATAHEIMGIVGYPLYVRESVG